MARKVTIMLLYVLAAITPTDLSAIPPDVELLDALSGADQCLRKGEWELRIYYRAKGSRSEGLHGELFFRETHFQGASVGKEIESPFGKMKFFGSQPKYTWEPSGWLFADKRKHFRSWQSREWYQVRKELNSHPAQISKP